MEEKLFEKLDKLDITETNLLLKEDINLSLPLSIRKRIEKSVKKKTGYYNENNTFRYKINNIFGGIFMKRKAALALSTVILLSLGGGGYVYAKTPMAYVSLDINPSVELGVNAFDNVVSAEAYNEDGKKVLEGTDLINSNIDTAVSTIISNAISEGYIKEDGSSAIEITTSTNKGDMASELEESLKETADKTLDDNNVKAEVETENVALARRDEARQLGITSGKLNLIQKLQELDPAIKVEDYKASSVKDIMKKTKELRKNNKSGDADTSTNTNVSADINSNISTDTNLNTTVDANAGININDNDDAVTEDNKQETLSATSVDSKKQEVMKQEKNNNGNAKKEENASNSQEENNYGKEKKSEVTSDENKNKNVNAQGNKNSSKSENNSSNSNSQNNKAHENK